MGDGLRKNSERILEEGSVEILAWDMLLCKGRDARSLPPSNDTLQQQGINTILKTSSHRLLNFPQKLKAFNDTDKLTSEVHSHESSIIGTFDALYASFSSV